MSIINLTPHELKLFNEDGRLVATITPSGQVARVRTQSVRVGEHAGVPLYRTEFGDVEGLPAPQPDTIYVVSGLVRAHPAVASREDVYSPGRLLRDAEGRVVGAVGLTR